MRKEKKTLVYVTMECFADTDVTVLGHLTKEYNVVWYYIYESRKANRLSRQEIQDYASTYGIDVHLLDPLARRRSLRYCVFYFMIAEDINRYAPDVVCYAIRDPYWMIAVKMKLKCKNVVLGIHDVLPHSTRFSLSDFLDRKTRNLSIWCHRNFLTYSSNQHELLKSVFKKDSYMVGMSCKYMGDSSLSPDNIESSVRLLFFGAIQVYKGLDLLISAMETLRQKGVSNLSLTIAGRGDYWSQCEALIKTKEMFNLNIRFVETSEVPDLMCSHHFLVLPYRDATQSGPLATAVAYELPIIAPNFGCFAETLSKESAVLYEQGTLEGALQRVARMSTQEYSSLKKACHKVKEANSEESIADNYIKAFNEIIR